jgi:hypothetical protein
MIIGAVFFGARQDTDMKFFSLLLDTREFGRVMKLRSTKPTEDIYSLFSGLSPHASQHRLFLNM